MHHFWSNERDTLYHRNNSPPPHKITAKITQNFFDSFRNKTVEYGEQVEEIENNFMKWQRGKKI